MRINTILPVSRVKYLDRVLESLKNQTHKPDSLIVVFDLQDEEAKIALDKFKDFYDGYPVVLVGSNNKRPAFAISERREHIASIHNQLRELVDGDWVFSIEDDGVLPPDSLEKLVSTISNVENVGMVTGVELGRWGVPYVGAWRVDDINEPKLVTSMISKTGLEVLEEIDGCGLYCALIRADLYKTHQFDSHNGLGPDVNLGIYLRQQGYQNYIDWGIPITHLTNRNGVEMEIFATDYSQLVTMTLLGNDTWAQHKYGQTPPYGL